MRIAVVTPCHNTPLEQLNQCHRSVLSQTVACTHIVVDDGSNVSPWFGDAQIIRLPHAHRDTGNVARAAGAVSAIGQDFEAIAFLDADNWYEPTHLETLVNLHISTEAAVCTSSRNLYTPEGELLGKCPEVDGERFVDTNCMFITRGAFKAVAFWYLMPPAMRVRGDRFVWDMIVRSGLSHAHTGLSTVAYRTLYLFHYNHFGVTPPAEAKELRFQGGKFVAKTTGSGS